MHNNPWCKHWLISHHQKAIEIYQIGLVFFFYFYCSFCKTKLKLIDDDITAYNNIVTIYIHCIYQYIAWRLECTLYKAQPSSWTKFQILFNEIAYHCIHFYYRRTEYVQIFSNHYFTRSIIDPMPKLPICLYINQGCLLHKIGWKHVKNSFKETHKKNKS